MTGGGEIRDEFIVIPLRDGRTLSARLFRPTAEGRFPAILDFSPYRCFDIFRSPNEMTLPVWARAGYATLAIDIAGSGASDGVLRDEYLAGEIDDTVAVIAWAAAQEWCDGHVGLSGLSWAGFNALRAAGRKPAALKAMVLGGVSDDGWLTDIHYLGGALYTAQVDWAGVMLMFNALPPDPLQAGEAWRAQWLERLAANEPWIVPWLSHPAHDTYWTDKAAPPGGDVPLLLYAGLADKYAASVLRIAEHWQGPVRTILGPWEHTLPHVASREPRIGFPQEALAWWDRFLKDRPASAEDTAPLRLWTGAPDGKGAMWEGRWRALDWPQKNPRMLELALRGTTLAIEPDARWHRLGTRAPARPGLTADLYEDAPAPFDLAAHRETDALVALSDVMETDVELAPGALLRGTAKGSGLVVARLLDLAPDGTAIRMTTGALNVSADGVIAVPFQAAAWRVRAGHRLVLVLSANGWPAFWTKPGDVELRDVRLSLPLIETSRAEPVFPPAEIPPGPKMGKPRWLDPAEEGIAFQPMSGASVHETASAYHLDATGTDYGIAARFEVKALADGEAWAAKGHRVALKRPGWSIRLDTRLEVRSSPGVFEIAWLIEAAENGQPVHRATRKTTVPRTTV